jgi:hypothetical protein
LTSHADASSPEHPSPACERRDARAVGGVELATLRGVVVGADAHLSAVGGLRRLMS